VIKGSGEVSQRRGARGSSRVERRTMDSYVGNTNGRSHRRCGHDDRRSRKLAEVEHQLRPLRTRDLDAHRMATGVARFGSDRRHLVVVIRGVVIVVRFNQGRVLVPMLVGCRTVVMSRMIVPGVRMDVQRRHDTWCGNESRDEQRCQDALHVHESIGGASDRSTTG
jgi:hypothetical protein